MIYLNTFVSKITLIRLIFPYLEKMSWILSSDVLALKPNTPRHLLCAGGVIYMQININQKY